jgi:hypothetical protein
VVIYPVSFMSASEAANEKRPEYVPSLEYFHAGADVVHSFHHLHTLRSLRKLLDRIIFLPPSAFTLALE